MNMALHPKIDVLHKYLDDPIVNKIPNLHQDSMSMYFLTFMGELFLQGYRILQKIGSQTVIVSLMEFQTYLSPSFQESSTSLPQYKVVRFVLDVDVVNQKNKRVQIFKDIKQIVENIQGSVQINIIYLKNQKYSVMNINDLQLTRSPESLQFFKQLQYLPEKKTYKHIDAKQQGTRLHGSVEYIVKGSGFPQNMSAFKRNIIGDNYEIRFSYNIQKVINTIRVIIGKQVIQNDFLVMSSQKWMRKTTEKVYKRFDLILRNQKKICIIDWKFSKDKADQKVHSRPFFRKNQLYYQLAKKDYRSDVQLKFYCVHIEKNLDNYHTFTQASYQYTVPEVMIDPIEQQDSEQVVCFQDQNNEQQIASNFAQIDLKQNKQNSCMQQFKRKNGLIEQEKLHDKIQSQKSSNKQSLNTQFLSRKQSNQQTQVIQETNARQMQKLKRNPPYRSQGQKQSFQKDMVRKIIKTNQNNKKSQQKSSEFKQIDSKNKNINDKINQDQKLKQKVKQSQENKINPYRNSKIKKKIEDNNNIEISSDIFSSEQLNAQEDPSFELIEKDAALSLQARSLKISGIQIVDQLQKKRNASGQTKNQQFQAQSANQSQCQQNCNDCQILELIQLSSEGQCQKESNQPHKLKKPLFDLKDIQDRRQFKHISIIGKQNVNCNLDFNESFDKQNQMQYEKINFDQKKEPLNQNTNIAIEYQSKSHLNKKNHENQENNQQKQVLICQNYKQTMIEEKNNFQGPIRVQEIQINTQNKDVSIQYAASQAFQKIKKNLEFSQLQNVEEIQKRERNSKELPLQKDYINSQILQKNVATIKKISISSQRKKRGSKPNNYIVILSSEEQN